MRKLIKKIRELKRKIKVSNWLIFNAKSLLNEKSYYPDEPRKSKWQIFRDQLYFIWKYGYIEKYYFTYGFDRISMNRKKICDEYIVREGAFLNKVYKKVGLVPKKRV